MRLRDEVRVKRVAQKELRYSKMDNLTLAEMHTALKKEHQEMKQGGDGFVRMPEHMAVEEKLSESEKERKTSEATLEALKREYGSNVKLLESSR